MAKVTQNGSVLSFVVIGGILVLLFVGGVYFVRQRTLAQPEVIPSTTGAPAAEPNKNDTPATPRKEEPAKKDDNQSAPEQTTPNETQPDTSVTLPQTGPAQTLMVLVELGLLTAVLTAYMRSRNQRATL
jgi:hypothetical protein